MKIENEILCMDQTFRKGFNAMYEELATRNAIDIIKMLRELGKMDDETYDKALDQLKKKYLNM